MQTPISFRLRKDLDADLIDAVEDLDKKTVNKLCRDGLRVMLGIRTTRVSAVQEQPLQLPDSRTARAGKSLPGKPAVFIPNGRKDGSA